MFNDSDNVSKMCKALKEESHEHCQDLDGVRNVHARIGLVPLVLQWRKPAVRDVKLTPQFRIHRKILANHN